MISEFSTIKISKQKMYDSSQKYLSENNFKNFCSRLQMCFEKFPVSFSSCCFEGLSLRYFMSLCFLPRSSFNILLNFFLCLAAPRQRIELTFDEPYYIEPSFECRFDHLEVRDGPFGFSPLINRYCGLKSPALIRSTGRFMWIKFISDEELEGKGFQAKYSFIPGKDV